MKVAGRWRQGTERSTRSGRASTWWSLGSGTPTPPGGWFSTSKVTPNQVTTDQAPIDPAGLAALLPAAWQRSDRHGTTRVECDHARLPARRHWMRGPQQDRSARVVIAGQAFVQHVGRRHDELAADAPTNPTVTATSDEPALAL